METKVEGNEKKRQGIQCGSFTFKAKITFCHTHTLFTTHTVITWLCSLDISILFHTHFL